MRPRMTKARRASYVRVGGVAVVLILIALIVVLAYKYDDLIDPPQPTFEEDLLVDLSEFDWRRDPYQFLEKMDQAKGRTGKKIEDGVCVGTQYHSYKTANGPKDCLWDIFLYVEDGIVQTTVVNNKGNSINFFGTIPEKMVENGPLLVKTAGGISLWIHPGGENLESFTVVPD